MKFLVIVATTLGMGSMAYAMPELRNVTCGQAGDLVRAKQSVVFASGRTYETYVSDDGQCPTAMKAVPAFVAVKGTHDAPLCYIGLRCTPSDPNTLDAP
jgi:hypothetical protein